MTKTEFQIIEMLGRVVAFGQAYEDKFPKKSLAGDTLVAIEAAIGKTYELAAVQDQRGMRLRTDERKTARDTLTAQLEAIRETSLGVSIDHPATARPACGHPQADITRRDIEAAVLAAFFCTKKHLYSYRFESPPAKELVCTTAGRRSNRQMDRHCRRCARC